MINSKPVLTVTKSGGVMIDYTFVCDTGKNLMTLKERANTAPPIYCFTQQQECVSFDDMYIRKMPPMCEFKDGICMQVPFDLCKRSFIQLGSSPLVPSFDFYKKVLEDEMNDAKI